MFRLGDKVRVKGNPAWKADVMAGVVGMTGVVTGITKTTILMDDADGMEWAWKPDCLEIINDNNVIDIARMVADIQSMILSNSNGDPDLELKVFSEWLKTINPKKRTTSSEVGSVQLEAVDNRPDQHKWVDGSEYCANVVRIGLCLMGDVSIPRID